MALDGKGPLWYNIGNQRDQISQVGSRRTCAHGLLARPSWATTAPASWVYELGAGSWATSWRLRAGCELGAGILFVQQIKVVVDNRRTLRYNISVRRARQKAERHDRRQDPRESYKTSPRQTPAPRGALLRGIQV